MSASNGLMLTSSADRATTIPTSIVACRTNDTMKVRSSEEAPLIRVRALPVRLASTRERIQKPMRIARNLRMFQAQRMPPCSEKTQFFTTVKAVAVSFTSTSRPLTAVA